MHCSTSESDDRTAAVSCLLLRLWQADSDDGQPVWRAALEDARTGERHGFADLARLCAFLEKQTANWTGGATPPLEDES